MSEPIQSISQGNYILQGTVATSAGIVGDGSMQNPLRPDETVLWSAAPPQSAGEISLSESFMNFEKIGISFQDDGPDVRYQEFPCSSTSQNILLMGGDFHLEASTPCLYIKWASFSSNASGTSLGVEGAGFNNIYGTNKGTSTATYAWAKPYKIIGINRKAQ